MDNKTEQRDQGINCPKCNFFIKITFEYLFHGNPKCPQCQEEFSMKSLEPEVAKQLYQKMNIVVDNVKPVKKKDD